VAAGRAYRKTFDESAFGAIQHTALILRNYYYETKTFNINLSIQLNTSAECWTFFTSNRTLLDYKSPTAENSKMVFRYAQPAATEEF